MNLESVPPTTLERRAEDAPPLECSVYLNINIENASLTGELLEGYKKSFPDGKAVQAQRCYSDDDFLNALADSSCFKIVTTSNNEVAGLCLVETTPDGMRRAYVDHVGFHQKAQLSADTQIYYVTAVFTTRPGIPRNIEFLFKTLFS